MSITKTCAPACTTPTNGSLQAVPTTPVSQVEIVSSCAKPVFVQLCDTTPGAQVEISDVALGCVLDAAGVPTGRVILSKEKDEETGIETRKIVAYMFDGTVIDPYSGAFGECSSTPLCAVAAPAGVLPQWG